MKFIFLYTVCLFCIVFSGYAEIVLDGTTGNITGKQSILLKNNEYDIHSNYGTVKGNNLFFSFEKFNIGLNETAIFNGPENGTIHNTISRITGNSISMIEGNIVSKIDNQNFFLVNPNGIIFGPDSNIDVPGAFYASTADYIRFSNHEKLFTLMGEESTFSLASPESFGFLDITSGSIDFDNIKNQIIDHDHDFYLIGGKVSFSNIQKDNFSQKDQFFCNNLYIASIPSTGEILISDQGTEISLFEVSEKIDSAIVTMENSYLKIKNKLKVQGDKMIMCNSEIDVDSAEQNENEINIQVNDLSILKKSFLSIDQKDQGIGGKINIKTNFFNMEEGSAISASSYNQENAGSIHIDVGLQASLKGKSSILSIATLKNAGNIYINSTGSILLQRSSIYSSSYGKQGDAGNITINSKYLNIDNTKINSNSFYQKSGDIILEAHDTKIVNNSNIYFKTRKNKAGILSINSSHLLINQSTIEGSCSLNGNAGDIFIKGHTIIIDNNATIKSGNEVRDGVGQTGHINIISSNTISILNNSSVLTESYSVGGGKIGIASKNLLHLNNSSISTSVKNGENQGGDLKIQSDVIAVKDSDLLAQAFEGDGGAIFILSNHFFKSNSIVSASSERGNNGSVTIDSPNLDPPSGLESLSLSYLNADRFVKTPCHRRSGANASKMLINNKDGIDELYDYFLVTPPLDFDLEIVNQYPSIEEALFLYDTGQFQKAIKKFQQILRLLDDDSNKPYWITIDHITYIYQVLGFYNKAYNVLMNNVRKLNQKQSVLYNNIFFNRLSDLALMMGDIENADIFLKKALETSRYKQMQNNFYRASLASLFNTKGNLYAKSENYIKAVQSYDKSISLLTEQGNSKQALVSYINLLHARFKQNKSEYLRENLNKLYSKVKKLPVSYFKSSILITLAALSFRTNHKALSYKALSKTEKIAKSLKLNRIQSFSNMWVSLLKYEEKKYDEAIISLNRAIFFAEQYSDDYTLFKCKWQLGKIYNRKELFDQSMAYYEQSIIALDALGLSVYKGNRKRINIFSELIKPVYLEYAALLLNKGDKTNDIACYKKVIDTMDKLKYVEYQNYYKDECLTYKNEEFKLESLPENTAIVYPISFKDHLTILFIALKEIKHIRVNVGRNNLKDVSTLLHNRLRDQSKGKRFKYYSKKMYHWLIHPIETDIKDKENIIFVPDDILRLFPPSCLHDGNNFLIEKYAVGMTPSLYITTNNATKWKQNNILLAGLSEGKNDFIPLEYVEKELNDIKSIIGGKILINENFTKYNISHEFEYNHYSIIHISTHGVFEKNTDDTYILAYDNKITMQQIENFIEYSKYRKKPVELLTLSACETATGDEQAMLGIAGLSIKSGVKSAIASLWRIDEKAAYQLITEFYRQLKTGKTKVKALQLAQKEMIIQKSFQHPSHWAAFILIGDWS